MFLTNKVSTTRRDRRDLGDKRQSDELLTNSSRLYVASRPRALRTSCSWAMYSIVPYR